MTKENKGAEWLLCHPTHSLSMLALTNDVRVTGFESNECQIQEVAVVGLTTMVQWGRTKGVRKGISLR